MINKNEEHLASARSLHAEIVEADAVWLPRREDLVVWLVGFIKRVQAEGYELGETEEADLAALRGFLRQRHVPASVAA
jgi:hypothetical protein